MFLEQAFDAGTMARTGRTCRTGALALALLLTACGGGGGSASLAGAGPEAAAQAVVVPSAAEAARFLTQATFGLPTPRSSACPA